MSDLWVFFCCFFSLVGSFAAYGNVVLIGNNVTLSFEDIEANFGEFSFDFLFFFFLIFFFFWGCDHQLLVFSAMILESGLWVFFLYLFYRIFG